MDEETIGSLFSYHLQSSGKSDEVAGKANFSPGKRILESKRLQNLIIMLKAVNATSDQVRSALTQGQPFTSEREISDSNFSLSRAQGLSGVSGKRVSHRERERERERGIEIERER